MTAHSKASGKSLDYFDDQTSERYVPYGIEPSAGVDRATMSLMVDAYTESEVITASGKTENRVLMRFHPKIAPIKVAVLPLSRNEKLKPLARSIYDKIRKSPLIQGFVQYDDSQSIGRRYRRQDEIGTPICVTGDFDSLDDLCVTIRERDTMEQSRISIDSLTDVLSTALNT